MKSQRLGQLGITVEESPEEVISDIRILSNKVVAHFTDNATFFMSTPLGPDAKIEITIDTKTDKYKISVTEINKHNQRPEWLSYDEWYRNLLRTIHETIKAVENPLGTTKDFIDRLVKNKNPDPSSIQRQEKNKEPDKNECGTREQLQSWVNTPPTRGTYSIPIGFSPLDLNFQDPLRTHVIEHSPIIGPVADFEGGSARHLTKVEVKDLRKQQKALAKELKKTKKGKKK